MALFCVERQSCNDRNYDIDSLEGGCEGFFSRQVNDTRSDVPTGIIPFKKQVKVQLAGLLCIFSCM